VLEKSPISFEDLDLVFSGPKTEDLDALPIENKDLKALPVVVAPPPSTSAAIFYCGLLIPPVVVLSYLVTWLCGCGRGCGCGCGCRLFHREKCIFSTLPFLAYVYLNTLKVCGKSSNQQIFDGEATSHGDSGELVDL
jgi:hypothetical protein